MDGGFALSDEGLLLRHKFFYQWEHNPNAYRDCSPTEEQGRLHGKSSLSHSDLLPMYQGKVADRRKCAPHGKTHSKYPNNVRCCICAPTGVGGTQYFLHDERNPHCCMTHGSANLYCEHLANAEANTILAMKAFIASKAGDVQQEGERHQRAVTPGVGK